jgi:antitoxin VapB
MAVANTTSRTINLFRNGRSQAVRIPKEFELPGKEVRISKEGDRLIIEPAHSKDRLLAFLAALEPLDFEWPEIGDPPPDDVVI